MVKVIVSPSAIGDAKEIFGYYESCSSHHFAKQLLKEFIAYARRLEQMPEIGPKEPLLEQYDKNYRYVLVQRRYKLIYLYEKQTCTILMVWDCKQNPKRLKTATGLNLES